ncbi:activating transcription factor 7-interacting protein 1 isoform X1 [Latimeria chalumnae]|uniref:Activating transcription factor 7 interacting protein n=1 Tax=Latimeria chalumnae TaxID=7897 RepID=H3APV9_LATCH|nr:PREDICTED: activating transcription factor 7-interacting protein 1 [Latimeria chalumnae]XP_014349031.1 PREDICTED: activating transcription factor 7-interacting protein 1 [Latimeria chalumnae]XP_014349032.1 PREDICTED: activating transcription factor 7-interacting protein 1 [Latimeria chalumnae]XP_014349033.1 PREDICTED: activating transcription factor 7-interacting protein 1 [Latimeria chalumnae]XP_014349034.1 PREDICTED: activating transcription factor 7-interacting protein 1 [Latimeria chalum|eukprot:XP_014349030.1 PREDICTED: activating transcription factor 7-interacting protein 1 [Latimeria chalumnae]
MDTAEEPYRKVFKARKTMRLSDRQQLEAVYKAKEELLKATEGKLFNGKHENGDSDLKPTLESTGRPREENALEAMNGIEDVSPALMETQEDSKTVPDTADTLESKSSLEQDEEALDTENSHKQEGEEEEKSSELENENSENAVSEDAQEEPSSKLAIDPESHLPEEESRPRSSVEDEHLDQQEKPIAENSVSCNSKELLENKPEDTECLPIISLLPSKEKDDSVGSADVGEDTITSSMEVSTELKEGENSQEVEDAVESSQEVEDVAGSSLEVEDMSRSSQEAEDMVESSQEMEAMAESSKEVEDELENVAESSQEVEGVVESSQEVEGVAESSQEVEDVAGSSQEAEEVAESSQEVEEVAESSQEPEDVAESSQETEGMVEDTSESVAGEKASGSQPLDMDTMETEDIIPILEKLAPVEDQVSCSFSGESLVAGDEPSTSTQEEKMDCSPCSPSKQDCNESLPKEAFLVLSDEDEPVAEKESELEAQTSKVGENSDQQQLTKREAEKSEVVLRKRSKSEDVESSEVKRRRFLGEEYEAELQVKITARGDMNKKLEKVVQRLLEEKLTALQCTEFDKSLADLRTRVEKLECKKHEAVLSNLQAKIARLIKRFGAAREDLKKSQEHNAAVQPLSPVRAPNSNQQSYRSTNTVRHMLESKRSLDSTAPLPTSSNSVCGSSITSSQAVAGQPKPPATVSSSSMVPPILPPVAATATATAVVGTSQPASSTTQPMSVSLQSLPVILHVPVAMSSQPQLLQTQTGTILANQQPGSVEFIPVQSQPMVGSLPKTPVSLASPTMTSPALAKPNLAGPVAPGPGLQRNSPASSAPSCVAAPAQTVSAVTSQMVTQAARTSLPFVGPQGLYNHNNSRSLLQSKPSLSGPNSQPSSDAVGGVTSRPENQTATKLTPSDPLSSKKPVEGASQSGRSSGGDVGAVIDLTLDDEDDSSSQDRRKASVPSVPVPHPSSQPQVRAPPQLPQQPAAPLQVPAQTSAAQTTMHVLPTAQTTVNVSHRPVLQTVTRAAAPRATHQMIYTTVPVTSVQNSVRCVVPQNQGLRQGSPQASTVTMRLPQTQTTSYVVSNGVTIPIGMSAPQVTVHHRPPQQEPPRFVHPAPLPEAIPPPRLPSEAASTSLPQKPHLKLARVQSQNGIVLSWSVLEVDRSCAAVDSYHLYAYHEDPNATTPSQWKKIGEVKALPLPMACTLTQFVSGSKYYFAVRAKDIYGRFGPFCDPQSTDVISSQAS